MVGVVRGGCWFGGDYGRRPKFAARFRLDVRAGGTRCGDGSCMRKVWEEVCEELACSGKVVGSDRWRKDRDLVRCTYASEGS